MYDAYTEFSGPDPQVLPDYDPFEKGGPRVTGWRTGKPSSFSSVPEENAGYDPEIESADVGYVEGGGHLYGFQGMRPPWDQSGAGIRSYGRPPWDQTGAGLRSADQGGAARRREVPGSDVDADWGFSNKTQGDVAVYYQEPPDSYFRMGENMYPETNPSWENNRAAARGTDEARATVPIRMPGAKQKTYVFTPETQEAMQPVSYRDSWGAVQRPWAPGKIAQTVGTVRGIPEWSQYAPLDSPEGDRQIPPDASAVDYQIGLDNGYSPEDVYY
jgi:hypothetical protein